MRYLPFTIYYLPFHLSILKFSNQKIRWKMELGKWKIQSGQSLFEVVVAISISALIMVALVSLVTNSIRNSIYSRNNSLAATYAGQAMEWLRGQRDGGNVGIYTFAGNARILTNSPGGCFNALPATLATWPTTSPSTCPSPATIPGTSFVRRILFKDVSVSVPPKTIIEADVSVSWTDSQGTHTVTSATSFSDLSQR